MSANNYPEFNAAVTELTNKVSGLLTEVATVQSVVNIQIAVDKAAEAVAASVAAAGSEASAAADKAAAGLSEVNAAESEANAAASEHAASVSEVRAAASELAAAVSEANAEATNLAVQGSAEMVALGKLYVSYEEANLASWDIAPGALVRVLLDETRDNLSVWYRSAAPVAESLSLGFASEVYSVSKHPLEFLKGPDYPLVAVPASSTSPGNYGDRAVDTTYLYMAVAPNTWRRVALSSF